MLIPYSRWYHFQPPSVTWNLTFGILSYATMVTFHHSQLLPVEWRVSQVGTRRWSLLFTASVQGAFRSALWKSTTATVLTKRHKVNVLCSNNNNNNNSKTMFMVLPSWQSHCESLPGSFDECRMAPSGRQPKTKPDDLGCESACTGCQKLHPPSPFIIIN